MKKSNWQRAKELILGGITAADSYSRADIIRLLRKNRVQDTDGNWVDQLLRALVDGGKLKRTGKRGSMRYAGAGRRKAIDLRTTRGTIMQEAMKAVRQSSVPALRKFATRVTTPTMSVEVFMTVVVNGVSYRFDMPQSFKARLS